MDQGVLDLEDLFEEHSVSSCTVASPLSTEYTVCAQHGIFRAPPTEPQVANRLRGAQLPRAPTNAFCQVAPANIRFRPSTWRKSWSDTVSAQFLLTDLLAMVAGVYICVKLHFASEQVYFFSSLSRPSLLLSLLPLTSPHTHLPLPLSPLPPTHPHPTTTPPTTTPNRTAPHHSTPLARPSLLWRGLTEQCAQ